MFQTDPIMNTHRVRISTLALGTRLPTLSGIREYVEAGILMSYGANFIDLFRRAGDYVDKILRGAKPADLPVEEATKFDLVINLTTAKVLGLKFSEAFLLRVDPGDRIGTYRCRASVKGFGCRPDDDGAARAGGRRPKASKGGNRAGGTCGGAAGAMGI